MTWNWELNKPFVPQVAFVRVFYHHREDQNEDRWVHWQRTNSSERWLGLCIWLSWALHGDKVNPELAPDTLTVGDREPYRNRQGSRSRGPVDIQGQWNSVHFSWLSDAAIGKRHTCHYLPGVFCRVIFGLCVLGPTQLGRAPPEQCTVRDGERQSRLWEQRSVRICAARGLSPWRTIKSCQTYRTSILESTINAHVSTQESC